MPLSKARARKRIRAIRADAKATAQKIIALSLPERATILPVEERKRILSQLAQLPPEHSDPIKAISELNRMEHIYDASDTKNTTTYNQVILQAFTIEELRLLVQNRLSVQENTESIET